MGKPQVFVVPEEEAFMDNLVEILVRQGYKANSSYAEKYVRDLGAVIAKIPQMVSYGIAQEFQYHFERYGENLRYVFYRRGTTTWYFFFQVTGNLYIVKHITNNWLEG